MGPKRPPSLAFPNGQINTKLMAFVLRMPWVDVGHDHAKVFEASTQKYPIQTPFFQTLFILALSRFASNEHTESPVQ